MTQGIIGKSKGESKPIKKFTKPKGPNITSNIVIIIINLLNRLNFFGLLELIFSVMLFPLIV